MSEAIERAAGMLAGAGAVVVVTGAGMSQESGIPTFREAPSALWANYDPMQLATVEGFRHDPPLVWRWYAERRALIARRRPHAGHHALARLEGMFDDFLLVTQNIDNLHRVAGSRALAELHGNIFRYKCLDRNHPVDELPPGDEVPPRCHCGSMLRPDVVWFGEMLPAHEIDRAYAALAMCDVVLVVGTSGLVYPAAGLPGIGRQAGARVVEVNLERTPISADAHVCITAKAGEALPQLVERLEALRA
jgi:NAD-dependent deacetylase